MKPNIIKVKFTARDLEDAGLYTSPYDCLLASKLKSLGYRVFSVGPCKARLEEGDEMVSYSLSQWFTDPEKM